MFCNMVMRYWVIGPGRFDTTMLSRITGHQSHSDAASHQEERRDSSAKRPNNATDHTQQHLSTDLLYSMY